MSNNGLTAVWVARLQHTKREQKLEAARRPQTFVKAPFNSFNSKSTRKCAIPVPECYSVCHVHVLSKLVTIFFLSFSSLKCNQLSLTRKKIIKIRPQLSELSCGQKEEHTKAEEIG